MSEITIVVCFVDIDGIVDHHRLNFPFMINLPCFVALMTYY